jgi:hypothetical protein
MPTTSCKEPTKEFQDTKPSVVKCGDEGSLFIYLVLPPTTKANTLVGQGAHDCRQGTDGGRKGAHICEGAYTPVGVGCEHLCGGWRARLLGGAHACGKGAHACRDRARTSAGGAHPCGKGAPPARGGHARHLGGAHASGGARTFLGGCARLWRGRTLGCRGSARRWRDTHGGGEGTHACGEGAHLGAGRAHRGGGARTGVGRARTPVQRHAVVVEGTPRGKASICKRNFLFNYPQNEYID